MSDTGFRALMALMNEESPLGNRVDLSLPAFVPPDHPTKAVGSIKRIYLYSLVDLPVADCHEARKLLLRFIMPDEPSYVRVQFVESLARQSLADAVSHFANLCAGQAPKKTSVFVAITTPEWRRYGLVAVYASARPVNGDLLALHKYAFHPASTAFAAKIRFERESLAESRRLFQLRPAQLPPRALDMAMQNLPNVDRICKTQNLDEPFVNQVIRDLKRWIPVLQPFFEPPPPPVTGTPLIAVDSHVFLSKAIIVGRLFHYLTTPPPGAPEPELHRIAALPPELQLMISGYHAQNWGAQQTLWRRVLEPVLNTCLNWPPGRAPDEWAQLAIFVLTAGDAMAAAFGAHSLARTRPPTWWTAQLSDGLPYRRRYQRWSFVRNAFRLALDPPDAVERRWLDQGGTYDDDERLFVGCFEIPAQIRTLVCAAAVKLFHGKGDVGARQMVRKFFGGEHFSAQAHYYRWFVEWWDRAQYYSAYR